LQKIFKESPLATSVKSRFSHLLLEILHGDPSRPNQERLLALSPDEWHEFTAEAIRYRLAFQVKEFFEADSQYGGIVPQECLLQLGEIVRKTLMNNLRQQAHLRKMLALLKEADIPVILLKGLWLGETVYCDLKARATGDIDLLLRSEDMPRFTKLVRELGFDLPANTANICDLVPSSNEFTLLHPTRKSVFDIHWALTRRPIEKQVDEEKFWQRSEIYTIAGKPCRSLCMEDHLLYLCFHAALHHRFSYVGPRALLDIARLIANPPRPIDWNDLVARSRELNWDRGIWLMLDLTRKHLGSQLPTQVLEELCPAGAADKFIHALAMEAIFLDQSLKDKLSINIVNIAEERSLLKRAALLYERLFPASEEIATHFKTTVNSPGFRWLYFRRLGLLVRNHLPKIFLITVKNVMVMAEKDRLLAIERWMDGDAEEKQSG
jgi:Uncharacterised nucleotidyltransferase